MAKKNFIEDNPALQFISTANQVQEEEETTRTPARIRERTSKKGYKIDYRYTETKSKRVQLLIQPTLWELAKEKADKQNKSLNDYINGLIRKDLKKGE